MKNHVTYQLEEFIFGLTEIPGSDILVDMDLSRRDLVPTDEPLSENYTFSMDSRWSAVIKNTLLSKRNSDTDTLCLAVNGIRRDNKGKHVLSPLFLIPATYIINRIRQEIQVRTAWEHAIFNPFLKNELLRKYGFAWEIPELPFSEWTTDFMAYANREGLPAEAVICQAFGNFHHHRYQIVRELEGLLQLPEINPIVRKLLGDGTASVPERLELTAQRITATDSDQQHVFERFQEHNLVVQGPPGTGKSQVLTNLISKLLFSGKKTLVVSEKKVALEVLVKKLSLHQLDVFTFMAHSQTKPADFIDSLKNAWHFLEQKQVSAASSLMLSEQLSDQLELSLHKLASKDLVGGISFTDFKKLLHGRDLSAVPFTSDAPGMQEWLSHESIVRQCLAQVSSPAVFRSFPQSAFNAGAHTDTTIESLLAEAEILCTALDFQTYDGLEMRIRQSARCQILENESYKKYHRLFTSKRESKKFEKLRLAYIRQSETLQPLDKEQVHWKIPPTLSQAQTWKQQLAGQEGWWKKRQAQKAALRALNNPGISPSIAVDNWISRLEQADLLQETRNQLLDLGIENPGTELESVHYILQQLGKEDENELNQTASLSAGLKKALVEKGQTLAAFRTKLHSNILIGENEQILEKLVRAHQNFLELAQLRNTITQLPAGIYRLMQRAESLEDAENIVLKSNLVQFGNLFPELARYDGNVLKNTLNRIIETEISENELFSRQIILKQQQQFDHYHRLLITPAQQLTADEKTLKSKLKKGKSLLVKSFRKSRQYPTIRELFDSDARVWIELLNPVFLSTPTQIAQIFPLETSLFDCAIFDEASQMILPAALGALQRSQRALIAGDAQQMSPSSYFTGQVKAVDLLHQASYYWEKTFLRHHYRSEQPALIAFSNRHFYNNELIVYPSPSEPGAVFTKSYFVEGGIFENRMNPEEARQMASLLKKSLNRTSIAGIVAFSEIQLNCIWNALDEATRTLLQEKLEQSTAFFRPLEQVQGEECDELFISLGYGYDTEGKFSMRFGPLNQENGSKRLNVLFTRAKKKIHFFHSVHAGDFKWTANESVRLLQQFISSLEIPTSEQPGIVFPFGLQPEIAYTASGNILTFSAIQDTLTSARELLTLHRVLRSRGWEIIYDL